VRPETATSITDHRATPNRKTALRSDFSSNISTTSDNEDSVNGADCTIPELPWEGGYTAIDKCHDNALSRRTHGIQYNLVIFIMSRTTSAARRPKFAVITIREYRQRTGDSERNIYLALAALEQKRFIERDERGAVRACPENFAAAPLPAARTCRKRERVAAALAPASVAALRVGNTAESIEPAGERADDSPLRPLDAIEPAGLQLTAVRNEPVASETSQLPLAIESPAAVTPLKLTSVADETNCKKPETYCPWNWVCPHLSVASPLVSIETKKQTEPTTTGVAPAPDEIAYLARFLQPATRIGELLQIDDAAAGRMWRDSIARNPELTPREFVLIVRMKLQEWRRVDDARPGMRVRSVTSMLIGSMPNAVVGAFHLLAREQAPAELARDCEQARGILANDAAAPRDRAWARAVLAERKE
jgi:hypothetical protein